MGSNLQSDNNLFYLYYIELEMQIEMELILLAYLGG